MQIYVYTSMNVWLLKYIFSSIYFSLSVLQFSSKIRDVSMHHPVMYVIL